MPYVSCFQRARWTSPYEQQNRAQDDSLNNDDPKREPNADGQAQNQDDRYGRERLASPRYRAILAPIRNGWPEKRMIE